eukprot:651144-Pleurochrysis_carterae.AAC.2
MSFQPNRCQSYCPSPTSGPKRSSFQLAPVLGESCSQCSSFDSGTWGKDPALNSSPVRKFEPGFPGVYMYSGTDGLPAPAPPQ